MRSLRNFAGWASALLARLIHPLNDETISKRLLAEAKRLAVEHEASREHHAALAKMYRARVARLSRSQL